MKWFQAKSIVGCPCVTENSEKCLNLRGVKDYACHCLCHDYGIYDIKDLEATQEVLEMTDDERDQFLRDHGIDPDMLLPDLVHRLNAELIDEQDEARAEKLRGIIRELEVEL